MLKETIAYSAPSVLAAALLLLIAFTASAAAGTDTIALSSAENGREITVRAGAVFTIGLDEQGSTGYLWDFDDLDGAFIEVMNVTTTSMTDERLVGAPVRKIWTLRATRPGVTEIKLLYFRSWEGKDKAVRAFRVTVRITG